MPLARFCLSTHLECRRISAGVTCPSAAPRRLASLTKSHCSKGSGIETICQSRLRTIILPESYTAFEVLDIIFLRGRCLRQISFPGSSDCTSVWMLRGKHLESLEWGSSSLSFPLWFDDSVLEAGSYFAFFSALFAFLSPERAMPQSAQQSC